MKPLRLMGIDKLRVKKNRHSPEAYPIDLPPESTLGHAWQDTFEREWKRSRHLWDWKLFVASSKLRLFTPPSDIPKRLEWIEEVIELTDKGICARKDTLRRRFASIYDIDLDR